MNLFIRADASTAIGTGHVMRCLALAQAWQDQGGGVTFISHCESGAMRQRLIDEGINFIAIDNPHPDSRDIQSTLSILHDRRKNKQTETPWIVVDGYHFDSAYQKKIKDVGHKLLWIDDYGHADRYYADIVLNQNISADESLYKNREPYTRLLLSTRYVLLRREFKKQGKRKRAVPKIARKMLVTLGGADSENRTLQIVQSLKKINIEGLEVNIVIGPANPHHKLLSKVILDRENFSVIISSINMPALMSWSDIAISAAGSTCWELSFIGTPFFSIVIAENQKLTASILEGNNMTRILKLQGDNELSLAASIESVLKDETLRKTWFQRTSGLVDGNGVNRVLSLMKP